MPDGTSYPSTSSRTEAVGAGISAYGGDLRVCGFDWAGLITRLGCLIACGLVGGLALLAGSNAAKGAGILLPRHRLAVLARRAGRAGLTWGDRGVIAALALRVPPARRVGMW